MAILSIFQQFQWWQLLIILLAAALFPLVKAIAVVYVAKRVDTEIAKLAIPLILRRPHFLFWRKLLKSFKKNSKENKETINVKGG